jgi:hypothetical protein
MRTSVLQKAGAVFGPAEIASMSAAYHVALSSIHEEGLNFDVPGHELRRRLASRIIEETRRGPSDPQLVAERALAGLSS